MDKNDLITERKFAKTSSFKVNSVRYKNLSDLGEKKVKDIVIERRNAGFKLYLKLYEGNNGQLIIYNWERYPCFDSADRMHENRRYHWYFICDNMSDVEEKLAFMIENDLHFNSSNMKYQELCPIVYVDDGKPKFEIWATKVKRCCSWLAVGF